MSAAFQTKKASAKMADGKFELLGPIFAEIGGELAQIVGDDPDGTFLYAEAGPGWYASGIFKEDGNIVRYYDPTRELGDLLFKAWNAEEPGKRWAVMEYVIEGTKFDVQFLFRDEIDPEESEVERRPRALKRRFGNRPVDYGPSPFDSDSK